MKRKFYEVSPRTLLIIAGIVWMLAGYNVARLGVISYLEINVHWYHFVLSVIIFILFGTMFAKMTKKHGKRIKDYKQAYRPFWNFFDLKSYIIMAVMMSGGIGLRASGLVPNEFIAFFYTGLGLALFLAGVLFVYMFLSYKAEE